MLIHRALATSVALLIVVASAAPARASTKVDPNTEYLNRIKVAESIQPLGETPFGENVSLYTGAVSFRQTDINFPGIGPTITLTRTYEASGSPVSTQSNLAMGDWDLAVPEIATMLPGRRGGYGGGPWAVYGGDVARCTKFNRISQGSNAFGSAWWHGYQLITGDGTSQSLLKRTPENTLAPSGNTAAYPALTAGGWQIGCLSATSNGKGGEGFLGVAPDGTRYWFDYLVNGADLETLYEIIPWSDNPNTPQQLVATGSDSVSAGQAASTGAEDPNVYYGIDILYMPRMMGHMYASRVEDRFGNWVSYRYAGNLLQEITASDGRQVEVKWRTDVPLVDSITLMPGTAEARTWRYSYEEPADPVRRRLVGVQQPDNTSWAIETHWASLDLIPPADPDGVCGVRTFTPAASDDGYVVVSMVHPSGLRGDFELSVRGHARSWVPTSCEYRNGALSPPSEHLPPVYTSLSLTAKTFSGPGVAPRTWRYRYSPAVGSTAAECTAAPCRDWQWVEVTDPEMQTTHYRFSTHWGYLEGKLIAKVDGVQQPGTDTPVGLASEGYVYADPALAWTFPSRMGEAMEDPLSNSNTETSERLAPEVERQKILQNVRFIRQVSSFDRYGNPETVRRASVPGDSRTETTTYWPVDSQWVLGQPWKVSQDGRVVSQTDYDSRILPQRIYSFGLLQATYGYAPNGMLASISDPRTNTTQLSDHKRGIPQLITFADATQVAPAVDDFGQVKAVRNQLNDTSNYTYDAMGRMRSSSFPSGDATAWNPITRNFVRVDAAAYGLPAGHWKHEVRNGSALATTLYDALWRPRLLMNEIDGDPSSRSYVVKRFDSDGREVYSSFPVATAPSVDDVLPGVRTTYDALGRLLTATQDSELGPLMTRSEYLSGFRTRVTNPRGHSTTTSYQTFDEPSEASPVRIESPEGVTTLITRDGFGKPLTITRTGPAN